MKNRKIPSGYKILLFDVTSLFKSTPLDKVVNLNKAGLFDGSFYFKKNLSNINRNLYNR